MCVCVCVCVVGTSVYPCAIRDGECVYLNNNYNDDVGLPCFSICPVQHIQMHRKRRYVTITSYNAGSSNCHVTFSKAREEMYTISAVSIMGASTPGGG